MQVSLSEFLKKVSELKTKKHKVEALRLNDSVPLRIILQGAFDPSVVWLLPPGTPPYKPTRLHDQEHILIARCTKLRYFIKGWYDNLKQNKRESLFIEMLETVDKNDAELLCAIKDKKFPYEGITAEIVKEALPNLILWETPKEERVLVVGEVRYPISETEPAPYPDLEPVLEPAPYPETEPAPYPELEPELEPAPAPRKVYRKSGKH
jgi:hypothetical protein